MSNRRRLLTFAAASLGAIALGKFGPAYGEEPFIDDSPEQKGRVHTKPVPEAIEAIRGRYRFVESGTLTVGVVVGAPPISLFAKDVHTIIGSEPDFASLLAEALDLRLKLVPISWPDWPLGLSSGRFDTVIANVGVTEERKEKFDFSTYRLGLHGFYVPVGSPIHRIAEPRDVAGLRIITGAGAIQDKILGEWNKLNVAQGLKPVQLLYFDDETTAQLALVSGRADAEFNPDHWLGFEAAQSHKIRRVGLINAGWPNRADVGAPTRKGSGLAPGLTIATNALIAGGQYLAALRRWGLEDEAITRSETNPPGLPKLA